MDLDFLRDRRVVIAAACGALALFAILGIGVGLIVRHHHRAPALAESSAPHTLQVEMGHEDGGLDSSKPLRCFVGGQFVGMDTLSACAKKNGVAPEGSRPTSRPPGAAGPGGPSVAQATEGLAATPLAAPPSATGACWSYAGDWRKVADEMTLDSCVQAQFAGHCEPPGAADYGRWNGQTLRLVTGRVEIAGDNRSFRTLIKQGPEGCVIPNLPE